MKEPRGHKVSRKLQTLMTWMAEGRRAGEYHQPVDGREVQEYLDKLDCPFRGEQWDDLVINRFVYAPKGVKAIFTTRGGGFSKPPYDSLNLGYHVDDDVDLVGQNRDLLCSILGIDRSRLTVPRQRHSTEIKVIDDESKAGAGTDSEISWLDPCDGLITRMKNVPLMLLFADCVPLVLTVGGDSPVVGVIHAGRRGIVDGIVARAVEKFVALGYDPASILAAIGPAIGQCCYEVDEETASEFAARFGPGLVADNHLDLVAAVTKELTEAGVLADNIAALGDCTACNTGLYSFRRDGTTGRHAAIAWIAS